MAIKRTSHAVYDTTYHLVWAPKYRRWIVRKDVRRRAAELFREIADDFEFEISEMEVSKDHVHILLSFPPIYSISSTGGARWLSTRFILGGLGEFPPIEESSSDEGQVVSEQVVFCGAHLPEEAPPFGRGASLSHCFVYT